MTVYDEPTRAVLRAGLAWLYDTEQPPEAHDEHHGASCKVGARRLTFVPRGFRGPGAVIVVDVATPLTDGEGNLLNPLAPDEREALTAALADLGRSVRDHWNGGRDAGTLSIELDAPAHPSLLAAVSRYHAGCPTHHTPLCAHDGCTWHSEHLSHLIGPTWPTLEAQHAVG